MLKPIANWLNRHHNPTNFWLHMLGIPMCFVAAPLMLYLQLWVPSGGLFVGGYALQFLGHLIEGNRSGEEMLFRAIFRLDRNNAKPAETRGKSSRRA